MDQHPNSRQVEDDTFPFGGYAKSTVRDVVANDGIRFGDDDGPFLVLVVDVDEEMGVGFLEMTGRSEHVRSVLGQAGLLPRDELADALKACVVELVVDIDDPIWIRL